LVFVFGVALFGADAPPSFGAEALFGVDTPGLLD